MKETVKNTIVNKKQV